MAKISKAQQRKIFILAREHGLDDELRREYIHTLTSKTSTKFLTMKEAIKVIDNLEGKQTAGRITTKQRLYIEGMAKEIGWVDEVGKLNQERLNTWLHKRYGVSHITCLTSKAASDAIEGLKAMIARKDQSNKEAI